MSPQPDSTPAPQWSGPVRLWSAERLLGTLHIDLQAVSDRGDDWTGRVHGSDYLVWGANLAKSQIEFPWGERAEVVLRAGGRVRGLGPRPSPLVASLAEASGPKSMTSARRNPNPKEQ